MTVASPTPSSPPNETTSPHARSPREQAGPEARRGSPLARRPNNLVVIDFRQMRRNTNRKRKDKAAQFSLAIHYLTATNLIDWRNHWSPPRRLSAELLSGPPVLRRLVAPLPRTWDRDRRCR
jgi:hypothetical protein